MEKEQHPNERLAIIETRLTQLECDVKQERDDRRAMAKTLFQKLDHATDRIASLERHLWFAIGALTVVNLIAQYFLK